MFEIYNLPTQLRRWFVQRLIKEFKDQQEAIKEASKGSKTHTLG
jgi:hypothetical protein